MQQSTLQEILGVEKEIRQKLDAEREKASQWLEGARREVEAQHAADVARLEAAAVQRGEEAKLAAVQKADEAVRQAEAAARAVDDFTDDELRQAVVQHIVCIAPRSSRAG
jgi:flagellar biosynthesis/type III secretory pathway protein FliH